MLRKKGPSFKEPGKRIRDLAPAASGGGEWWEVLPGRSMAGSWTGEWVNGAGAMVTTAQEEAMMGLPACEGTRIAQRNLFLFPPVEDGGCFPELRCWCVLPLD